MSENENNGTNPVEQPAGVTPKYTIKVNHYPNIAPEDGFAQDFVNLAYKYNLSKDQAQGLINDVLQIRDEEHAEFKELIRDVYSRGAAKQEEKIKLESESKAKQEQEALSTRLAQEFNGEHQVIIDHAISKAKGLNMSEADLSRFAQVISNEPSTLLFLKDALSEYDKSVPAVKVASPVDDKNKPTAQDIDRFNRSIL